MLREIIVVIANVVFILFVIVTFVLAYLTVTKGDEIEKTIRKALGEDKK